MKDVKESIILEEGTSVKVSNPLGNQSYETTALVGKATRQFFSEVSLESHRQLQFISGLDIQNGFTVYNLVTGDTYIIVANYPEVIYNELCAIITRAIVCNSKIYVGRLVEEADRFGNIEKEFKYIYSDVDIYLEAVDSKIISALPGEFEEVKYKVFAPDIKLEVTDRVEVLVDGSRIPFKLLGRDYTTFKGLTVLNLISETRRDA